MPSALPLLRALRASSETLLIAFAGGTALAAVGFPAGLICGSVLAVAAAALLRRPVKVPAPLARICFALIGIQLGAVISPNTLTSFAAWPASIVLVMIASLAMILVTTTYLHKIHHWDRLSALLGASPGSMTQVIALASELRCNLPAIAIVQTLRVLLLTTGIPGGLALFGLAPPSLPLVRAPPGSASLAEIAMLLALSGAAAYALWHIRFPAGLLFGAMVGSVFLHGSGLVQAALPWWLASAAILVLGALIGSRFAGITPRLIVSYLGAAFGSFAVSLCIAGIFALIVALWFSFPIANVMVAFSPGALDTMMVLALALHLDPVFVGAHHIARFFVTSITVAIAARRMEGKRIRH